MADICDILVAWQVNPFLISVFKWTEERQQLLVTLWAEGLSAREIAERLGEGATRNAVIGKANRMKLSARNRSAPKETAQTFSYAVNRGERYCQWPYGHPDEEGFRYCQKAVFQEHPYCQEHSRQAYRNVD